MVQFEALDIRKGELAEQKLFTALQFRALNGFEERIEGQVQLIDRCPVRPEVMKYSRP